jgi:predicted O-methyltransferase YrrM
MWNRIKRRLTAMAVDAFPRSLAQSLWRRHREVLVEEGCKIARTFDWAGAALPKCVNGFEDLAGLFWCTALNRGVLRQDIDEAATLFRTIRGIPKPRGVEIGRFHGASTLLLAVAVGPEGKVVSMDIAPQNDTVLRETLQRLGLSDRVELLIGDANEIQIPGPLDFAFIDGDHLYEGARKDHNRWGSLVGAGGYIIHHDMACAREFATQWTDLARLRSEILAKQAGVLELVTECGSVSVFRKTSDRWVAV